MKRTILFLTAAMMLGMALPTMAQTVSFDDQTQFVVTKGNGSVNIRKAPNTKAQKVGSLAPDATLPVLEEQNGWYQVLLTDGKKGWISQSVCRISEEPFVDANVCDHLFGVSETYEDYVQWSVGQIKGTDMYVAITVACNMDEPISVPWVGCAWLGKKVGNALVFDQYVFLSFRYSENTPDRFEIYKNEYIEDDDSREIYFGDKYSMPDNQGGIQFRPSSLPINTIKQFFNGKQKKDLYLFLGPALLGKKYADVVFG